MNSRPLATFTGPGLIQDRACAGVPLTHFEVSGQLATRLRAVEEAKEEFCGQVGDSNKAIEEG